MNKLKPVFFAFLLALAVVCAFGGDLVYKTEKEVKAAKNEARAVLGEFDTPPKTRTLRVGASVEFTERAESGLYVGGAVVIENIDGADSVEVGRILLSGAADSDSIVVNVPGKRLRFSATGSGKYKVFVWSE